MYFFLLGGALLAALAVLSEEEESATVLPLLHGHCCQQVIKAGLLFAEMFFCSLASWINQPEKKLLINPPFSDGHLTAERAVLRAGRL